MTTTKIKGQNDYAGQIIQSEAPSSRDLKNFVKKMHANPVEGTTPLTQDQAIKLKSKCITELKKASLDSSSDTQFGRIQQVFLKSMSRLISRFTRGYIFFKSENLPTEQEVRKHLLTEAIDACEKAIHEKETSEPTDESILKKLQSLDKAPRESSDVIDEPNTIETMMNKLQNISRLKDRLTMLFSIQELRLIKGKTTESNNFTNEIKEIITSLDRKSDTVDKTLYENTFIAQMARSEISYATCLKEINQISGGRDYTEKQNIRNSLAQMERLSSQLPFHFEEAVNLAIKQKDKLNFAEFCTVEKLKNSVEFSLLLAEHIKREAINHSSKGINKMGPYAELLRDQSETSKEPISADVQDALCLVPRKNSEADTTTNSPEHPPLTPDSLKKLIIGTIEEKIDQTTMNPNKKNKEQLNIGYFTDIKALEKRSGWENIFNDLTSRFGGIGSKDDKIKRTVAVLLKNFSIEDVATFGRELDGDTQSLFAQEIIRYNGRENIENSIEILKNNKYSQFSIGNYPRISWDTDNNELAISFSLDSHTYDLKVLYNDDPNTNLRTSQVSNDPVCKAIAEVLGLKESSPRLTTESASNDNTLRALQEEIESAKSFKNMPLVASPYLVKAREIACELIKNISSDQENKEIIRAQCQELREALVRNEMYVPIRLRRFCEGEI